MKRHGIEEEKLRQLINRVAERDVDALDEIRLLCGKTLYAMALGPVEPQEAEHIVGRLMEAIWREARNFKDERSDQLSASAWILQRFKAEIADAVKRKQSTNLQDLLKRISDADQEALGELRQVMARDIRKCAIYKGLSSQDADDIVQEVCLALWKDASRFRGEASPAAWIMQIARNKINDWWRKYGKEQQLSTSLSDLEEGFDDFPDSNPGVDPQQCVENSASRTHLSHCLEKLPYKFRDYLIKAYQFEISLKEISLLWRCPEGTVKSGLSAARDLMKKCLERKGVAL